MFRGVSGPQLSELNSYTPSLRLGFIGTGAASSSHRKLVKFGNQYLNAFAQFWRVQIIKNAIMEPSAKFPSSLIQNAWDNLTEFVPFFVVHAASSVPS